MKAISKKKQNPIKPQMEDAHVCCHIGLGRVQREYLPRGRIAVSLEIRHNERASFKRMQGFNLLSVSFHFTLAPASNEL